MRGHAKTIVKKGHAKSMSGICLRMNECKVMPN